MVNDAMGVVFVDERVVANAGVMLPRRCWRSVWGSSN
jgi:hypothetical protein